MGGSWRHVHQGTDNGTCSREFEAVRLSHIGACESPGPHHAGSPLSVPLDTERHIASEVIQPRNVTQGITSIGQLSTGYIMKVAESNFDGLVRLRSLDQPQCRLHQLAALFSIIPCKTACTHDTWFDRVGGTFHESGQNICTSTYMTSIIVLTKMNNVTSTLAASAKRFR